MKSSLNFKFWAGNGARLESYGLASFFQISLSIVNREIGPPSSLVLGLSHSFTHLVAETTSDCALQLNEDHEMSSGNEATSREDTPRADNDSILGWCSCPTTKIDLSASHPPPALVFTLWKIYLLNVDPVVKVLHAPTMQRLILEASKDLSNIPRPLECLMFAIYSAAVNSMDDVSCFATMNESKTTLAARYQVQCEHALRNADLFSSFDLTIVQAYFIFIVRI